MSTLRTIINIFCLNRKIFTEIYTKNPKFKATVNGLCEFQAADCREELLWILSKDPFKGTKPRHYYMRAVWNNLKQKRHEKNKSDFASADPKIISLVGSILEKWGGSVWIQKKDSSRNSDII